MTISKLYLVMWDLDEVVGIYTSEKAATQVIYRDIEANNYRPVFKYYEIKEYTPETFIEYVKRVEERERDDCWMGACISKQLHHALNRFNKQYETNITVS